MRKAQHEQAIKEWMLRVVSDGGIERFDDLHVDLIDEAWKDRNRWVEAGSESYRIARDLRSEFDLPLTVSIAFSLKPDHRDGSVDFQRLGDLESQLDHSPPSLYLFRKGSEPWIGRNATHIESLRGLDLTGSCYYLEFQQDTAEHHRSLLVAD